MESQWSLTSPSDSEQSPMGKVGECKDLHGDVDNEGKKLR